MVAKVRAETRITTANPFANAQDKHRARKQAAGIKALADRVKAKIDQIQKKISELAGKAVGAISKFTAAMVKAGMTSLGAPK